jgi:hypothetical protein
MKLGVTLNIFSGLEFLKPSILNVRDIASYIVGVVSMISSAGHPCASYLPDLISDLLKEKLLDEVIYFSPKITNVSDEMIINHRLKRELGREVCIEQECTHLMAKDCDEFYDMKQVEEQHEVLENNDVCLAPLVDYIKSPLLRGYVSILHVPVFSKIEWNYASCLYPVLVDRGRMIKGNIIKIFKAEEYLMHHFSCVRINEEEMMRKKQGHSCYNRMTDTEFKGKVRDSAQGYVAQDISEGTLTKVEDVFGIKAYWDGEFQKYIGEHNDK